jgi:hypothetical protein
MPTRQQDGGDLTLCALPKNFNGGISRTCRLAAPIFGKAKGADLSRTGDGIRAVSTIILESWQLHSEISAIKSQVDAEKKFRLKFALARSVG